MGRHDWYRRTTWTEDDRNDFFTRLSRSRTASNKHQYASIQGGILSDHGYYEPAIELLHLALSEWPDP